MDDHLFTGAPVAVETCPGCGRPLTGPVCSCGRPAGDASPAWSPPFRPRQEVLVDGLMLGSRWQRISAWLIDLGIVSTVALTLIVPVAALAGVTPKPGHAVSHARVHRFFELAGVAAVAGDLAYAAVGIGRYGQTFGKRAVGLTVRRSDGRRVGYLRALWRELARLLVETATVVGLLGVLWALVSRRRRTLHDALSGTIVLRES